MSLANQQLDLNCPLLYANVCQCWIYMVIVRSSTFNQGRVLTTFLDLSSPECLSPASIVQVQRQPRLDLDA
jgi:hypothetical protein